MMYNWCIDKVRSSDIIITTSIIYTNSILSIVRSSLSIIDIHTYVRT